MSTIIIYVLMICSLDASWECAEYEYTFKSGCGVQANHLRNIPRLSHKFSIRCEEKKVYEIN